MGSPDGFAPHGKKAPRGRPFAKGTSGNPCRRFVPGRSGNPGGRPRTTPYSDACLAIAELTVAELSVLAEDLVPIAAAKALAREALKGKVQAAMELANRAEGTPRQRHEITGDEEAVKVEAKLGADDLVGALRQIYGLSFSDSAVVTDVTGPSYVGVTRSARAARMGLLPTAKKHLAAGRLPSPKPVRSC